MDHATDIAKPHAKLESYRLLSLQFPDGLTAKNIRELASNVALELRKYGQESR
jgi:hypothetical protein